MSTHSNVYQIACVPGPKSAAAVTRGPDGSPVLVVYLDPVNMTIYSEPSLAGARGLASFFRELAREAAKFAAQIDPTTCRPRKDLVTSRVRRPIVGSGVSRGESGALGGAVHAG